MLIIEILTSLELPSDVRSVIASQEDSALQLSDHFPAVSQLPATSTIPSGFMCGFVTGCKNCGIA